jgi:hypothetical protein
MRSGQRKQIDDYERLSLLNQHCSAVTAILNFLGKRGAIPKRDSVYYRLMVEEVRALCSQSIVESLDGREVRIAASISSRRIKLEKQLFNSK